MIILSSWKQFTGMLSSNFVFLSMFYLLVGVYLASFLVEYLAYRCFKEQSEIQHGVAGGGFGRIGGQGGIMGMGRYDDQESARTTNSYMVSGPGVNNQQQRQEPARGNTYSAFKGAGVRLGGN